MKTNEVGISLNTETKRIIADFVENNFVHSESQQAFWKYQITELVEKCIYTDSHAEDNMEYGTND